MSAAVPPEDDIGRKRLEYESLPNLWPDGQVGLTWTLTVDREDAAWISQRIYEDVDRGLITVLKVHLNAVSATQCILLSIGISIGVGLALPHIRKGLDILVCYKHIMVVAIGYDAFP